MTTALAIITRALKELGIAETGQALDSDDVASCLDALNVLTDAWLLDPTYAYATNTVTASLPTDTTSLAFTHFSADRPIRLEAGCFVTVNGIDYPLEQIDEAQYNAIPIKNLPSLCPSYVFFDAELTPTVYFFPTGACTVSLVVLQQMEQWTLNGSVTLPPGIERALALSLAEEMAPTFKVKLDPVTIRNAKQARRDIKRANIVVPQLDIGSPLSNNTIHLVSSSEEGDGTLDGGSA